jgi:hypothetical protein
MPTVKAGTSVAPTAHRVGASSLLDATATTTRVVLASSDPVFAALCKRALGGGTKPLLLVGLSPPEPLETLLQLVHDVVVLDADGRDTTALKALATKVMLLSEAPIVLVSAYLAPGSPGLGTLLQSIAARFVQKPQGSSSLSLAGEDGPPFAAALQAALAEYEDDGGAADDIDAGWDVEAASGASQAEPADD